MRNTTFFGSRFNSRAVKTENPFPRSFFAPKPDPRKRLLRRLCRLPRVSVRRASTVYLQFIPKTSWTTATFFE